jgi:hypothetical protein
MAAPANAAILFCFARQQSMGCQSLRAGAYNLQADLVLQPRATLNDTQKMVTELFDKRLRGFGAVPILQHCLQCGWTLEEAVAFDAATHAVSNTCHTCLKRQFSCSACLHAM